MQVRITPSKLGLALAVLVAVVVVLAIHSLSTVATAREGRTGMAVEFMDHAASAYVAQDKGWYEARGLKLSSYTSYATGMALASALARKDVQVAYLCLVPAINAYANAGVAIKIVAGTHRHGYALVVNPNVVSRIEDLARDEVRVGCVRQGGAVDVLMNKTADRYGLDRRKLSGKVRRMSPPQLLVALASGHLDCVFLPEQWASMAEDNGFRMLLTAQDVWPGLQGSVLVVKQELLVDDPELVRALVEVNEQATQWINAHPQQAADTLARVLSITSSELMPAADATLDSKLAITPATMLRSMNRLDYTTAITVEDVQAVIDYQVELGYVKQSFPAEELMDTRFLP